jgi:hypothetical protein
MLPQCGGVSSNGGFSRFALSQDPGYGSTKILRHATLRHKPGRHTGQLILPSPSKHKKWLAARIQRSVHIAHGVAHNEGRRKVQIKMDGSLEQETRSWLSASASVLGAMGAAEDGIYASSPTVDLPDHPPVDGFKPGRRDQTPSNGRLVADHHDSEAALRELAQRGENPRQKDEVLPRSDVRVLVVVDHAVAI